MTQLNETQLSWVIEKLTAIHQSPEPWKIRDKVKELADLLESRLPK